MLSWPQVMLQTGQKWFLNCWPMNLALVTYLFKIYVKGILGTSKFFFTSAHATPTANRAHRDFSRHHRNHSTAFLPRTSAPHHLLCGRTQEGPPSWILSFKALSILVTFFINTAGNQKGQKEQASCWKGCMQQSHGMAVSGLIIPIKTKIKTKDQAQGNSAPSTLWHLPS